jgi:aryl sulfotransferase
MDNKKGSRMEKERQQPKIYKTWATDSTRWEYYHPRDGDVVITTYPKCGTTWMQRIVSMLVFASDEPRPVWDLSPWPDARFGPPIDDVLASANAQTHRRFFKSHLPLTALPVYDGVQYIHVARDGRDACMSLHNHLVHFSGEGLALLDGISQNDPKFGDAFPRAPADAAAYFHAWVVDGGSQGDTRTSFFQMERSFWEERRRSNVLLVHYNDLKADREGEMRRIARFLGIALPDSLWPQLVEAAGFEAMKRDGETLIPMAHFLWEGGPGRFLNKGTNGRWRDVVAPADLAEYEARVKSEFSPALARWVEHGRRVAGEPRDLPD